MKTISLPLLVYHARDAAKWRPAETSPGALYSLSRRLRDGPKHHSEVPFRRGPPAERKAIVRTWVDEITLKPEELEVEIRYRLPETVVKSVGAGACSHDMHNQLLLLLGAIFVRRISLAAKGRWLAAPGV